MRIIECASDFVMDAVEFIGGIIIDAFRLLLTLAVAVIILAAVVIVIRFMSWDLRIPELFPSVGPTLIQAETATVSEMES